MSRPRLLTTPAQWLSIVVSAALGFVLFTRVDLEPRAETDFFFSSEDPQLRSSGAIDATFGYVPQVFVAVRAEPLASREFLLRLRDLTQALDGIPGVSGVSSLTHGPEKPEEIPERDPEDVFEDLVESPFWSRLLLAPDRRSTFVVVPLEEEGHEATVRAIDGVLGRFDRPGFRLAASGVPYVSEHIRENLTRDLQVFSLAALLAFALLTLFLFRSLAVLFGTLLASLTACFATFDLRALLGMSTSILTPNLWTVAFVLTLSHVVYLTASFRRIAREKGKGPALRQAVRLTAQPRHGRWWPPCSDSSA